MGTGMRQIDVIQNILLASLASDHDKSNILWGLDSLVIKGGFKILAGLTHSARARQFLLSTKLNEDLKASCSSRLRIAFASSQHLENMICAPDCIQLNNLLAPGKIVLIDLGEPTGGLASLQEFWANMLVRIIIDNLMQRPSPWSGHHCRIVIDEAQVVAKILSDTAERVLTTGRSRGVSLSVLSQGTALLRDGSDSLLKILLTNAPTKFIGRLSAQDAELLSREQSPKLGVDESIYSVRSRLVASITNLEDRNFYSLTPGSRQRFRTVDVPIDRAEVAARERASEIEIIKTKLAIPRDQPPRITLDQVNFNTRPRSPKKVSTKTQKPITPKPTTEKSSSPNKPKRRPRSPWG